MTQEKNTTSFLQYLQTVAPFLSSDMKKEALALVSLFEAFGVEKVADLSKPVLDMQKKIKNSADGFSKRVEAYFAAKNSGQTPAETAISKKSRKSSTSISRLKRTPTRLRIGFKREPSLRPPKKDSKTRSRPMSQKRYKLETRTPANCQKKLRTSFWRSRTKSRRSIKSTV